MSQSFAYDLRGNVTNSIDDKSDFFDRSLGATQYAASGPDQLSGASATTGNGSLVAFYDNAGNLTKLNVLPQNTTYAYGWDELGHLSSASVTTNGQTVVQEQFAYDAEGQRVRTTHHNVSTGQDEHTLRVFDSLVLERAAFNVPGSFGDYVHTDTTENVYLTIAGTTLAHVFNGPTNLPNASLLSDVHTYMLFGDPTGSTSFVVDHDTGELVERPTYQAYGAVESDYRPPRWDSSREDVRYTGHWDDAEVGLVYFGARYYNPQLGRWISPDPLTIHGLGGDLNPYAFVRSSPIGHVDPFGLEGEPSGGSGGNGSGGGTGGGGSPGGFLKGLGCALTLFLAPGCGGGFPSGGGSAGAGGSHASPPAVLPSTTSAPFQLYPNLFLPVPAQMIGVSPFAAPTTVPPVVQVLPITTVLSVGTVATLGVDALYVSLGRFSGFVNTLSLADQGVLAGAGGGGAFVAGNVASDAVNVARDFTAIGSTGRVGEVALQQLGGEPQAFFRTTLGARFVDQLVNGVAHESKVGYQSLTQTLLGQIAKEAELLRTGQVSGYTWHFFESPVTGAGGPSGPLLNQLERAGINVELHF